MQLSRNNHYVPKWYQEGFLAAGDERLHHLDLAPASVRLPDGRSYQHRSKSREYPKHAFRIHDLYSTRFGDIVDDEIERKLFGAIDTRGAAAIRAFTGTDVAEWHRHFQTLFEYIDIQKLRTPKGLDWLRAQYPKLGQNELMMEMQGVRAINCTTWSEGVREIVSASGAGTKFIVTDHPVTIYNHAIPADAAGCRYPLDPNIALKASQTLFALDQGHCLIFTNLEYAQDPDCNPVETRAFARNYGHSMVRTDAFIRTRELDDQAVREINFILKSRARRYIAAGREEWLYPERHVDKPWSELRRTLLPVDELWRFGGEIFGKMTSGEHFYQDAFGRTAKPPDYLKRPQRTAPLRPGDPCGCGSVRRFRDCCRNIPEKLRPSWTEMSIRARNLFFYDAIEKITGLDQGKDWVEVRREMTDEKIAEIYELFGFLWPIETDLMALLPKPDGRMRAVYTGLIRPDTICDVALGASLLFGELIIETPFVHPAVHRDEMNPVKNPRGFRHEILKSILFLNQVMPLIEAGLVTLIPDPCIFNHHLRDQMMHMADARRPFAPDLPADRAKFMALSKADTLRTIMSLPPRAFEREMDKLYPDASAELRKELIEGMVTLRESDPLATLQSDNFEGGKGKGQLMLVKLVPNYEIAMYLAQATGAAIVTDSEYRWNEIIGAIRPTASGDLLALPSLARAIAGSAACFPTEQEDIVDLAKIPAREQLVAMMRETSRYLQTLASRGTKPNVEARLTATFQRSYGRLLDAIAHRKLPATSARMIAAFPSGGIQDNHVTRLLLMAGSEAHSSHIPMAFFIDAGPASDPGSTA